MPLVQAKHKVLRSKALCAPAFYKSAPWAIWQRGIVAQERSCVFSHSEANRYREAKTNQRLSIQLAPRGRFGKEES
jgi:hypothetical protein